jgi:hypothetical protein
MTMTKMTQQASEKYEYFETSHQNVTQAFRLTRGLLLYLWKFHRTITTKLSIIQPSVPEMCISLLFVYDISYWIILLDHDTKIFYQKSVNSNCANCKRMLIYYEAIGM